MRMLIVNDIDEDGHIWSCLAKIGNGVSEIVLGAGPIHIDDSVEDDGMVIW